MFLRDLSCYIFYYRGEDFQIFGRLLSSEKNCPAFKLLPGRKVENRLGLENKLTLLDSLDATPALALGTRKLTKIFLLKEHYRIVNNCCSSKITDLRKTYTVYNDDDSRKHPLKYFFTKYHV